MLDYKEDDILTTDQLIKMVNENINYKNNKYLKYLVTNQIISGISYKNFKNYISLIDDIIKNGKLNYREKYALIELFKRM